MASQMRKATITFSGTTFPYSMWLNGADYCLKCARGSENGRYYNLLSSMLFSAFSLEAFLNHIGQQKISYWEEIVRISSHNKLRVILKQLKFNPDLSARPFQTFNEIFTFRNAIVHAQTATTQNKRIVVEFEEGKSPHLPYSKQDELTTLKNAEKFYRDADAMIKCLWEKSGLKRGAPGVGYSGWYEVEAD